MKTLNFSRKSWHYWVAKFGCGDSTYAIKDNLCGYIWQVIWGLIILSQLTVLGLFFAYCTIVAPILYFYAVYQAGAWFKPEGHILPIGVGLWLGIIFIGLWSIVAYKITEYKEKRREARYQELYNGIPAPKDSFIVAVWRKFHDKTCAKLEFK